MIDLLDPTRAPEWRDTGAGYIDLLGDRIPDGPKTGKAFQNPILPPIYEKVWRPIVGRVIFGRGFKADAERRLAMEMLAVSPGDRVLDVGCGTGNYARLLADAAGDGLVVGLDASASMLATAAKRGGGSNLAYLRGDAGALPFGNSEFDAICCTGVIHSLQDPLKSLEEMVRVLAPGGRIAIMAVFETNDAHQPDGDGPQLKKGVMVFGRNQLAGAMADHGLVGIRQHMLRRAEYIAAQKPKG